VARKASRPEPFKVTGTDVRVRIAEGPREDGRWRWRADRQDGPKRANVWSGWATQAEAEQAVLDALAAPAEPEAPPFGTVEDLLSTWTAAVDERSDVSVFTQRACTTAANRLLEHGLGEVFVDQVTRRTLERYRDAALRTEGAGSTLMRDLKYLRQAWAWGREIKLVPDRDLPKVKVEHRARKPVYTRYTPTREEIARLLSTVRPAWIRRSLILLATTGARIGEIASLRWGAVSADCDRLELDGKTGRRIVPLHPTVVAELRTWTRGEPDALVLGVKATTATAHTQRELARAAEVLGLPRVSPNGLRRAMTDALYRSGVGVDQEAAMLGHSAETAMRIYRQVSADDLTRAVTLAGVGMPVDGSVIPFQKPAPSSGTDLSENLSAVSTIRSTTTKVVLPRGEPS
jgi:integrase